MSVDINEQHRTLKRIDLRFLWKWRIYNDLQSKGHDGILDQVMFCM